MPLIKGLFFDLDGTLADTFEALYAAYSRAFELEGHKFVAKDVAADLFPRRFDTWGPHFPHIETEKMKRIADHKARVYPEFLHLARPNHSLVAFVKAQRPHHQLVLVTTARRVSGERVLDAIGLGGAFHHVVFGEDFARSKPRPDAYLLALKKTGLAPHEALAFEDSEAGLAAADAAGIATVKIEILRES